MKDLIIVRGGGDIATGTIYKLVKSGFHVLILEIAHPSAIRRNVAFSEAVYEEKWQVEDMTCHLAHDIKEAEQIMKAGNPALMIDPNGEMIKQLHPIAVVDAILAKKNLGTTRDMAPITIALGPGFTAGEDVDVVIETMRGHRLGRIIKEGSAIPNTGIPGVIKGFGKERVIHSPAKGILRNICHITDMVTKDQLLAKIETADGEIVDVPASMDGLLRGLIRDGYPVTKGFKIADIDPRAEEYDNCFTISDKARCIAGGVLEALLYLKNNLSDQQEELEIRRGETLCHRPEEAQIDLGSTQAQVVIGVRRSGKSTLCFQALKKAGVKYAYVDFDDEWLANIQAEDLNDVLEVLYKIYGDFNYLFLDEIQNIEGWHLFVNRMLRRRMHVIITGSNAKLLSSDLATHLSGRCKEIPLFPFSFYEYCLMKEVDTEGMTTKVQAFRRAAFDHYLKQGGFPELLVIGEHQNYVKNLVSNILQRDIEQRFKITYQATFEQLAHHLLNVAPLIVSPSELSATLGVKSEHTIKNYIGYMKQAYLLLGLQKYSAKSKMRITQEKVYPIDVALMDQRDNALVGENLGWRLETIVYLQLVRTYKPQGYDIYYLSDRSGECDFVVCKNNQVKQAIQVSYDISSPKTRKREIEGLLLAHRKTQCTDLLLLTDHEYNQVTEKGLDIKIRPVYDWVVEMGKRI